MTPIPGTDEFKSGKKNGKTAAAPEIKTLGVYSKEPKHYKIKQKVSLESEEVTSSLTKWLKIAGVLSLICLILGFLVYKSFFILAIFIPIAITAIWYIHKFIEDAVKKFDSFSR